jgi:hypothetical protein
MADTPDPICARCGCYESAHGEGGRCEPVGWTFTATDTDTPERELIEKLLQLAHQQADGTDFHKGRKLTAEDTMYFVAARKIKALLSRVDKLEERVRELDAELRFAHDTLVKHKVAGLAREQRYGGLADLLSQVVNRSRRALNRSAS